LTNEVYIEFNNHEHSDLNEDNLVENKQAYGIGEYFK
jgi:hypothetical protein